MKHKSIKKGPKDWRKILKRVWYFIWEEDSIWSWLVNIILAFVLIKYVVYPGLGFLLGTSHPIVAVVSGSMEHDGSLMIGGLYISNIMNNLEFQKKNFYHFILRMVLIKEILWC